MSLFTFLNPFYWRQRKALSRRPGFSQSAFADLYRCDEVKRIVASALWNELQTYSSIRPFRIDPKDDFLLLYGLEGEDLEDVVNQCIDAVRNETGMSTTLTKSLANLHTLADLIDAIQLGERGQQ